MSKIMLLPAHVSVLSYRYYSFISLVLCFATMGVAPCRFLFDI